MSLMKFVEKWTSPDYPPDPVSTDALNEAEKKLHSCLPKDYKKAVLTIGLPRPTIALLDAIVDRELDVHAIGDFYSPSEIVTGTLDWREIGMPENLIAFASDGCGNMFCFDTERERSIVLFFDHDFGTVSVIAYSFDAWIAALCEIEPLSD